MDQTPYLKWRNELYEIQDKIDNYDEAYYDKIDTYTAEQIKESHAEYKSGRELILNELEAHYRKEPAH